MPGTIEKHDVIIVGAGQAGLATSYHLKQRGIDHIILERGKPGDVWTNQRWDSFVLNTPSVTNSLPGEPFFAETPTSFETAATLVKYFKQYVEEMELPFKGGVTVTAASRNADGTSIDVETDQGSYQTNHLIVASGNQNVPTTPAAANDVPNHINSIKANEYRNPDQMPAGAILVVGSAQTGAQITEDLRLAGRTVYLSTSKVGRFRRRIRGKDIVEWLLKTGMMNQTPADLENPADQYGTQPIASGVDGGRTLSLQSIANNGANLIGRVEGFEGSTAIVRGDLRENIEFADAFSAKITGMVNGFVDKTDPTAPPLEDEPADAPAPASLGADSPTRLDLDEAGITSIIWATGYTGDYSWIDLDGHSIERGRPVQIEGASSAAGLYFIGQPWLRTRGSGIIYGVDKDAEAIVRQIAD
jgi:putative flavoprotein involved in K+ transport